jgi:hypothetical protein
MLETLAIDDVIEVAQLDLQKALAKKSVRQVAGAARNFAGGLRQRMNALAEGLIPTDASRRQESVAGAGSSHASADAAAANDGEATSAADGIATGKPPRTKEKELVPAPAETVSTSQLSATA